jgi:hypothetical protein
MAEKPKEPMQTTDKGLEIPVPKRSEWDEMMRKVIKPADRPTDDEANEADEG